MFILHGDDQAASRQALVELKNQAKQSGKQIMDLDGANLTLSDLVTAAKSVSLLGDTNAVFIENLFSRRESGQKKAVVDYLRQTDGGVTIWESKDVTSQLKEFPAKNQKKFSLPKYIWQFLETLSFSTLHLALSSMEPEQLLALLADHLQKLVMVKTGAGDFPSWQKTKLASQAQKFTLEQLSQLNSSLLDIDYQQKTSSPPYDLSTALELWIIKYTLNIKY